MNPPLPLPDWIDRAHQLLLAHGFADVPGTLGYAQALANENYPELTPEAAVKKEMRTKDCES
jgi:hypothetical protein